jgi:hypothetical protein
VLADKLGGEPESFQLEKSGPNIYVHVPGLKQIVVVNPETKAITHWTLQGVESNFPMALDESNRSMFVAARKPACLLALDMDAGEEIASLPGAIDTGDMSFDPGPSAFTSPVERASFLITNRWILTATSALPKFPPRLARAGAYTGQAGKQNRIYLAAGSRANRGAAGIRNSGLNTPDDSSRCHLLRVHPEVS